MYKASIDQTFFDIELSKETTINHVQRNFEFEAIAKGSYRVQLDGNLVEADLVKLDKDLKQVVVRIEGKKYTIQIKEPVDILLEKLGIASSTVRKVNNLKAPMPGLVLKIMVKEGDEVKKGDPVLILEAMKMENVFKASFDSKIKQIKIQEKQAVEKGQELIVFE